MKKSEFVKIKDRPDLIEKAALWFHDKWTDVPASTYAESMNESLVSNGAAPRWYLYLADGEIVGGAGVIDNDFHDRKDLTPNICALYVRRESRRRGIAGEILKNICEDMSAVGLEKIYLVTEQTAFYERYGWEFLCMAKGDDGEDIRLYIKTMKGEAKNGMD